MAGIARVPQLPAQPGRRVTTCTTSSMIPAVTGRCQPRPRGPVLVPDPTSRLLARAPGALVEPRAVQPAGRPHASPSRTGPARTRTCRPTPAWARPTRTLPTVPRRPARPLAVITSRSRSAHRRRAGQSPAGSRSSWSSPWTSANIDRTDEAGAHRPDRGRRSCWSPGRRRRRDRPGEPAPADRHRADRAGDRRGRPVPAGCPTRDPRTEVGGSAARSTHAHPDRAGVPRPGGVRGGRAGGPRNGCAGSSPTPATSCARR